MNGKTNSLIRFNSRRIANLFRSVLPQKEIKGATPHTKLNRLNYKSIWNKVSITEDDAKMAVSGYVDKSLYKSAGEGTKGLLMELIGISPDDVVLEIGAGVGRVGAMLAPICKEWIGVDVSENMLSHIKRRLSEFKNVRTVATNGFDLAEIGSETVDVVYCTVVFMHLEEWERFNYIKEGFRVLKPGGKMLVDNVDITSDNGWAFFQDHCTIPPSERPAQISKTSTPQELETYFKRAGYQDIGQFRSDLWIVVYGKKPISTPSV